MSDDFFSAAFGTRNVEAVAQSGGDEIQKLIAQARTSVSSKQNEYRGKPVASASSVVVTNLVRVGKERPPPKPQQQQHQKDDSSRSPAPSNAASSYFLPVSPQQQQQPSTARRNTITSPGAAFSGASLLFAPRRPHQQQASSSSSSATPRPVSAASPYSFVARQQRFDHTWFDEAKHGIVNNNNNNNSNGGGTQQRSATSGPAERVNEWFSGRDRSVSPQQQEHSAAAAADAAPAAGQDAAQHSVYAARFGFSPDRSLARWQRNAHLSNVMASTVTAEAAAASEATAANESSSEQQHQNHVDVVQNKAETVDAAVQADPLPAPLVSSSDAFLGDASTTEWMNNQRVGSKLSFNRPMRRHSHRPIEASELPEEFDDDDDVVFDNKKNQRQTRIQDPDHEDDGSPLYRGALVRQSSTFLPQEDDDSPILYHPTHTSVSTTYRTLLRVAQSQLDSTDNFDQGFFLRCESGIDAESGFPGEVVMSPRGNDFSTKVAFPGSGTNMDLHKDNSGDTGAGGRQSRPSSSSINRVQQQQNQQLTSGWGSSTSSASGLAGALSAISVFDIPLNHSLHVHGDWVFVVEPTAPVPNSPGVPSAAQRRPTYGPQDSLSRRIDREPCPWDSNVFVRLVRVWSTCSVGSVSVSTPADPVTAGILACDAKFGAVAPAAVPATKEGEECFLSFLATLVTADNSGPPAPELVRIVCDSEQVHEFHMQVEVAILNSTLSFARTKEEQQHQREVEQQPASVSSSLENPLSLMNSPTTAEPDTAAAANNSNNTPSIVAEIILLPTLEYLAPMISPARMADDLTAHRTQDLTIASVEAVELVEALDTYRTQSMTPGTPEPIVVCTGGIVADASIEELSLSLAAHLHGGDGDAAAVMRDGAVFDHIGTFLRCARADVVALSPFDVQLSFPSFLDLGGGESMVGGAASMSMATATNRRGGDVGATSMSFASTQAMGGGAGGAGGGGTVTANASPHSFSIGGRTSNPHGGHKDNSSNQNNFGLLDNVNVSVAPLIDAAFRGAVDAKLAVAGSSFASPGIPATTLLCSADDTASYIREHLPWRYEDSLIASSGGGDDDALLGKGGARHALFAQKTISNDFGDVTFIPIVAAQYASALNLAREIRSRSSPITAGSVHSSLDFSSTTTLNNTTAGAPRRHHAIVGILQLPTVSSSEVHALCNSAQWRAAFDCTLGPAPSPSHSGVPTTTDTTTTNSPAAGKSPQQTSAPAPQQSRGRSESPPNTVPTPQQQQQRRRSVSHDDSFYIGAPTTCNDATIVRLEFSAGPATSGSSGAGDASKEQSGSIIIGGGSSSISIRKPESAPPPPSAAAGQSLLLSARSDTRRAGMSITEPPADAQELEDSSVIFDEEGNLASQINNNNRQTSLDPSAMRTWSWAGHSPNPNQHQQQQQQPDSPVELKLRVTSKRFLSAVVGRGGGRICKTTGTATTGVVVGGLPSPHFLSSSGSLDPSHARARLLQRALTWACGRICRALTGLLARFPRKSHHLLSAAASTPGGGLGGIGDFRIQVVTTFAANCAVEAFAQSVSGGDGSAGAGGAGSDISLSPRFAFFGPNAVDVSAMASLSEDVNALRVLEWCTCEKSSIFSTGGGGYAALASSMSTLQSWSSRDALASATYVQLVTIEAGKLADFFDTCFNTAAFRNTFIRTRTFSNVKKSGGGGASSDIAVPAIHVYVSEHISFLVEFSEDTRTAKTKDLHIDGARVEHSFLATERISFVMDTALFAELKSSTTVSTSALTLQAVTQQQTHGTEQHLVDFGTSMSMKGGLSRQMIAAATSALAATQHPQQQSHRTAPAEEEDLGGFSPSAISIYAAEMNSPQSNNLQNQQQQQSQQQQHYRTKLLAITVIHKLRDMARRQKSQEQELYAGDVLQGGGDGAMMGERANAWDRHASSFATQVGGASTRGGGGGGLRSRKRPSMVAGAPGAGGRRRSMGGSISAVRRESIAGLLNSSFRKMASFRNGAGGGEHDDDGDDFFADDADSVFSDGTSHGDATTNNNMNHTKGGDSDTTNTGSPTDKNFTIVGNPGDIGSALDSVLQLSPAEIRGAIHALLIARRCGSTKREGGPLALAMRVAACFAKLFSKEGSHYVTSRLFLIDQSALEVAELALMPPVEVCDAAVAAGNAAADAAKIAQNAAKNNNGGFVMAQDVPSSASASSASAAHGGHHGGGGGQQQQQQQATHHHHALSKADEYRVVFERMYGVEGAVGAILLFPPLHYSVDNGPSSPGQSTVSGGTASAATDPGSFVRESSGIETAMSGLLGKDQSVSQFLIDRAVQKEQQQHQQSSASPSAPNSPNNNSSHHHQQLPPSSASTATGDLSRVGSVAIATEVSILSPEEEEERLIEEARTRRLALRSKSMPGMMVVPLVDSEGEVVAVAVLNKEVTTSQALDLEATTTSPTTTTSRHTAAAAAAKPASPVSTATDSLGLTNTWRNKSEEQQQKKLLDAARSFTPDECAVACALQRNLALQLAFEERYQGLLAAYRSMTELLEAFRSLSVTASANVIDALLVRLARASTRVMSCKQAVTFVAFSPGHVMTVEHQSSTGASSASSAASKRKRGAAAAAAAAAKNNKGGSSSKKSGRAAGLKQRSGSTVSASQVAGARGGDDNNNINSKAPETVRARRLVCPLDAFGTEIQNSISNGHLFCTDEARRAGDDHHHPHHHQNPHHQMESSGVHRQLTIRRKTVAPFAEKSAVESDTQQQRKQRQLLHSLFETLKNSEHEAARYIVKNIERLTSILVVPLVFRDKNAERIVGVSFFINHVSHTTDQPVPFSADDENFALAFAQLTARMVNANREMQRLSEYGALESDRHSKLPLVPQRFRPPQHLIDHMQMLQQQQQQQQQQQPGGGGGLSPTTSALFSSAATGMNLVGRQHAAMMQGVWAERVKLLKIFGGKDDNSNINNNNNVDSTEISKNNRVSPTTTTTDPSQQQQGAGKKGLSAASHAPAQPQALLELDDDDDDDHDIFINNPSSPAAPMTAFGRSVTFNSSVLKSPTAAAADRGAATTATATATNNNSGTLDEKFGASFNVVPGGEGNPLSVSENTASLNMASFSGNMMMGSASLSPMDMNAASARRVSENPHRPLFLDLDDLTDDEADLDEDFALQFESSSSSSAEEDYDDEFEI